MFWVTDRRWQRLQVRIRLDTFPCRSPVSQSSVMFHWRPSLSAGAVRQCWVQRWSQLLLSLSDCWKDFLGATLFIYKVEIYLTSGALRPERSKYAKPPGAKSDFFRNDIKEKSELFPADARPKAALQPQSHDCHRIKGNLYLTLLQKAPQKAHSRFILPQ